MSTAPQHFFVFDGYLVRPVTEQDRPFLEMQIKADEYHREWMDADFFLKCKPGEDAWALEDQTGRVIFYWKTQVAARIFIQFTAGQEWETKFRNLDALLKGLAWLEAKLTYNNFREIIFDTQNPPLERFAKNRLGFVQSAPTLKKMLDTIRGRPPQPEPLGTVPNATTEEGR